MSDNSPPHEPPDDEEIDWEEEFKDDPDWQAIPPEKRPRLIEFIERALEMNIAAVYGDEDPDEPDADMDCGHYLSTCQARCCTLIFALTREEVNQGKVQYNKKRPFFIARDEEDGFCPHLDRKTRQCEVWEDRPLRCRRYQCRDDSTIWPNGFGQPL